VPNTAVPDCFSDVFSALTKPSNEAMGEIMFGDGGHSHGGGGGGSHSHSGDGGRTGGEGVAFAIGLWLVVGSIVGGWIGQHTYWAIRDVHVTAFDRYWGTLFVAMGLVELLALIGAISVIVGAFGGGATLGRAGLIELMLALVVWVLLIPRLAHWASGHPIVNPYF